MFDGYHHQHPYKIKKNAGETTIELPIICFHVFFWHVFLRTVGLHRVKFSVAKFIPRVDNITQRGAFRLNPKKKHGGFFYCNQSIT